MSVFSQFSIGISAMRAFRLGMDIAGYNVANANTEGFSRRRVELSTMPTVEVWGGRIGMGVDVSSLHRIRDPFLDFATRRESARLGSDQGRSDILGGLEPMLGEVDTAPLRKSISGLFDSFEQLAVQPASAAVRQQVVAAAQELSATLNRVNSYLAESRRSANTQVNDAATRVNEIVTSLRQINVDIVSQEAQGSEASDLRDQRDKLIDELSGLVPVRSVESSNGQVSVFLENTGDTLLSGESARPLAVQADASGIYRLYLSRGGERVDVTAVLGGGKLGGLIEARDTDIANYQTQLDNLASSLITEVNAVHAAGYGLDGLTGRNMFEPDPPGSSAAAAIHVNAAIVADASLIAASSAAGESGNNANALALVDLRGTQITALNGRSLGDYAADVLAAVGRDNAESTAAAEASQAILDALDSKRKAVSGVSLDEEAADLVKWQQSFEAAAKFMQTVNNVTQSALNMFSS